MRRDIVENVIFELDSPFRQPYQLHCLEFGSGAPVVSIVAGLHGNELNSIHALNLLATVLRINALNGTVRLFPLVNTFGADECSKWFPLDKADINKSFPGDPLGSPSERIAHALLQHTLDSDLAIDVHSGAAHVRELPQVRAPMSGRELDYARSLRLPLVWRRPEEHIRVQGLVGAWRQSGVPSLRIIGGRGITLDNRLSSSMATGLTSMLSAVGVMSSRPVEQTIADVSSSDIEVHRAPSGGFFVPEVRVGDVVDEGRMLGYLSAPIGGARLNEIRSNCHGVVISLRANPLVHSEELLVRLARIPKE